MKCADVDTVFSYRWQCGTEVPDSDQDWRNSQDLGIFAVMNKDVRWQISTILGVGYAGRALGPNVGLVSALTVCCISIVETTIMGEQVHGSRLCYFDEYFVI